ncbi:MAG: hypothetical protein ACRC37_07940, partial [Lentisphaeria bacterium]
IFATTEAHKVLPTVLSRCQRFDFKSIPSNIISNKLRQIADIENIYIEDMALSAIARAADGGMRDAQSIFDQMIAFCGGMSEDELIREQDVVDVFGLASSDDIFQLMVAMFSNDVSSVLIMLNNLSNAGLDLERLYNDLLFFLRNLTVVQNCVSSKDILALNEQEISKLYELSEFSKSQTEIFLDHLINSELRLRVALNKRVFLEMILIRAMKESLSVDINDIITSFNNLKNSNIERAVIVEKKVMVQSNHVNNELIYLSSESKDDLSSNKNTCNIHDSHLEIGEEISCKSNQLVKATNNTDFNEEADLDKSRCLAMDMQDYNSEGVATGNMDHLSSDDCIHAKNAIDIWIKLCNREKLNYVRVFLDSFSAEKWLNNTLYLGCSDFELFYTKKGDYDLNELVAELNDELRLIIGEKDVHIQFTGTVLSAMNVVEVPHLVKERVKSSKLIESVVNHFSGEIKDIRS